jgi:hypothetical protein
VYATRSPDPLWRIRLTARAPVLAKLRALVAAP